MFIESSSTVLQELCKQNIFIDLSSSVRSNQLPVYIFMYMWLLLGLFVYLCVSLSDCLCSSLSVLSFFVCLSFYLFVCLCLSDCVLTGNKSFILQVYHSVNQSIQ